MDKTVGLMKKEINENGIQNKKKKKRKQRSQGAIIHYSTLNKCIVIFSLK